MPSEIDDSGGIVYKTTVDSLRKHNNKNIRVSSKERLGMRCQLLEETHTSLFLLDQQVNIIYYSSLNLRLTTCAHVKPHVSTALYGERIFSKNNALQTTNFSAILFIIKRSASNFRTVSPQQTRVQSLSNDMCLKLFINLIQVFQQQHVASQSGLWSYDRPRLEQTERKNM